MLGIDAIDYSTTAGMLDRWTDATGEPWVLSAYDRDRLRSKEWHRTAEQLLVWRAGNWLYDNAQKLGCWETWRDTVVYDMPADWTGGGFLTVFDPVASWAGTYTIRVHYQGSITKTCPYYPNVRPECCYYSAELQGAYMVDDVYRWYKPEERGWEQFKNYMVPLGMIEEAGQAKEFSWRAFWQDAWQKSGRWDNLEAILQLAPHFGQ